MALYDFRPNNIAPFQFQPTLDGRPHIVTVPWNFSAQRFYVHCYTVEGVLRFAVPLIGSPTGTRIESLEWLDGTVTATTNLPHGYAFASTIYVRVSGCAPEPFNGRVMALVTGPSTFTYPLAANPGLATGLGAVNYNINMAGGYTKESVLLYRVANRQFETIP